MFLSAVWTLILTAPIHCRGSIGEQICDRGVFCDRCQLLDLPWEDVLVTHVFCYLPLRHLVSLQCVSKSFRSLIQVYLANCRTFDSAQVREHTYIHIVFTFQMKYSSVLAV